MTESIKDWRRFAEVTIKTNDLDPMYSVIRGLNQTRSRDWMGRFIIYFLCFYDAGGAAFAADHWTENYWEKLKAAGQDKTVRRGTERRHFRGVNALRACTTLKDFGKTPWEVLTSMYNLGLSPGLTGLGTPTYKEFYHNMTTQFAGTAMGPYFIWKLYDIFNICLDLPITLSFEEAIKYMPDEPRKAAEYFWDDGMMPPSERFKVGLDVVTAHISQFDHPVLPGAKCGLAEAETVLCMMKGFFKTKSHEIGDDIADKYDQLRGTSLESFLPPSVLGVYTR